MPIDRLKLLERLLDLTRTLSLSVDLEAYLQTVLSAASELTDSETASIMEYDRNTKEFYFKFIPWFHREALSGARVPLSGSVAGWIFSNVKPAIVNDTSKDERHYEKIDHLANFTTRSLAGAPLILRGKPIGVFEVFNKANGAHYTEEDVLVLETLASLSSTAIQNYQLENTVQTAREEARELNRMKNDFIAITSHELRTPLGLILGHATFLRELVGSEYHEQVDAIIRNASRLKEIIESLSNVDNYQTGAASLRQRRASMVRIGEDVIASFREMAAQKGITLKGEFPENDGLFADVDAAKIVIVLSNLVKNAVTFTPEGGHVTVRGSRDAADIRVEVQDDGMGIPAKDLEMIFERFYQVESHLTRKHGGMGLGLSVARGMIEMHGGRIWVESEEGKGSVFTFLLPLEAERSSSIPGRPAA
ncbi:MAG: GAF domain-containing sensor histidine kinase [Chloroflexi bacterium]|nr:GAF domain-containing sensor histidine kinase [Chloroflexota bacterium]